MLLPNGRFAVHFKLLIDYRLNRSVLVIEQTLHLQRAQMGDAAGGHAVVIEQIPLVLKLHDRVVGGPADNRLEDDALPGEGAVGIVADGVAQEMAVAGGV